LGALLVVGCSSTSNNGQALSTTLKVRSTTTTTGSFGGLTAEQLDAHLGVGVPQGWDPVDAGAGRVWVPKDWILESKGACIGFPSAVGMISIGDLPQVGCDQSGQYPIPKEAVALIPSQAAPTGRPVLTVHGYRIYRGAPLRAHGIWNVYVVPQLGLQFAMQGTLSTDILHTLAPSARTVALDPAFQTVPKGWHAVSHNGVAVSIPPSWTVATPNFFCASPVSDSTLLLVKPDVGVAPCPAPPATPAGALHDGVTLYLPPDNRYAPSPTGQPIGTLQPATTTIAIYPDVNGPNAVDLFVHRAGSNLTHVLALGLGRDGRIAAGVLGSIRADT